MTFLFVAREPSEGSQIDFVKGGGKSGVCLKSPKLPFLEGRGLKAESSQLVFLFKGGGKG